MTIRPVFARTAALAALVLAIAAFGIGNAPRTQAQQPQCTTVNMENGDEESMTARIVVTGKTAVMVTGEVDATACDIGVYIAPGSHATISYADIYSTTLGTAFGIYDDGGQVTVNHSQVHDILGNGESCGDEDEESCGGTGGGGMGGGEARSYTGGRHGTGILVVGSGAQGTISASTVAGYGRRGISVSGSGASARITNTQIIAPANPVSWLNGVWVANGAHATLADNTISGNVTGGNAGKSSSAIMIAGGASHNGMPNYTTGIQINGNTLRNNDTGVLLSNVGLGLDGTTKSAPDERTNNSVSGNIVSTNNLVGPNDAGIKDAGGNGDRITGNRISGYGTKSIVTTVLAINTLEQGNTIR